jgi:hypothetical protein
MNSKFPVFSFGRSLPARLALITLLLSVVGLSIAPVFAAASSQPDSGTLLKRDPAPAENGDTPASCEAVVVRHAPKISGTVDGSIRMLLPENTRISGSGVVTGDLLVPGTPTVRLNGHPTYGGTIDDVGNASPSNYQITLSGNAQLGHVVRRVDPIAMRTVADPTAPTGTLDLHFTTPTETVESWSDVRNLTLSGQADVRTVPAGSYGKFRATEGTGFILGVAGATEPSVYSFQSLALGAQTSLQVVGPVIVTLGRGLTLLSSAGNSDHPEWLTLDVARGGVRLVGGSSLYAIVTAPNGLVIVAGNSQLCGKVTSDRLLVVGNGIVVCCIGSDVEPPPGPSIGFPYLSAWKYMVYEDPTTVPADWFRVDFDDMLWSVGNGAFASGGFCAVQTNAQTFWPVNSDIVIRREFEVAAGVITVRIVGTVDNDVQIYLNGNLITNWVTHEGCPQPDDVSFIAPVGTYHTGTNLLAIRASDRGEQSFVDFRVEINN